MTLDKDRHKEIRENILEELKKRRGSDGIFSSHEKQGDIDFFREKDKKPIHIAEPDIVFAENDRNIIVVEIELSNSPKHLLGVAFAVMLSESCKFQNESFKINTKSLLLVLYSHNIPIDGSGKPDQIKELISLVENLSKKTRGFEKFDMVTEEKAVDKILEWTNTKKERTLCDSPPNSNPK